MLALTVSALGLTTYCLGVHVSRRHMIFEGKHGSIVIPALCGTFAIISAWAKSPNNPPVKDSILFVVYGVLLFLAWREKAAIPFIAGSSGGVLITFYFFVITALGDEKGHTPVQKLDFHSYAFVVPVWLGLCNMIRHLVQRRNPENTWILPFTVLGAFFGNVLIGLASGYLQDSYKGWDLLLYLFTSLCLYIFVIAGMIRFLEYLIRQEIPQAAVTSTDSQKIEVEMRDGIDQSPSPLPPQWLAEKGNGESDEITRLQSSDSPGGMRMVQISTNSFAFVLPSRAYWFKAFDTIFMLAFAIGWVLTLVHNQSFLHSNPILKVFRVNNICVGVDAGPARLAANCLWGIMLLPMALYAVTSYMQMHHFGKSKNLIQVSTFLLVTGYILAMCFGLSFGIEPREEDVKSIYIHTWGFALGMIGYSLMRLAELTAYYNEQGEEEMSKGYLVLLATHFFWAMLGALPLVYTLLVDDFAEELAKEVPTFPARVQTFAFFRMWVWTIGILLLPWITWWWVPEQLHKHELHLTPRQTSDMDVVDGRILRRMTIRSFVERRSCTSHLLRKFVHYSWVFYFAFIAIFMSPLNSNESKVITAPSTYRTLLYLGGCLMGICYCVAGVIVAVERPFATGGGSPLEHLRALFRFKADDGDILQCYAYIMLIPVGGLMGIFHVFMMATRLSGCTLGNKQNMSACTGMQTMWLMIWLAWFVRGRIFQARNGPVGGKHLWTALSLTLLGSCIIVVSMLARLVFLIESDGDTIQFNSLYTGGDWSQNC